MLSAACQSFQSHLVTRCFGHKVLCTITKVVVINHYGGKVLVVWLAKNIVECHPCERQSIRELHCSTLALITARDMKTCHSILKCTSCARNRHVTATLLLVAGKQAVGGPAIEAARLNLQHVTTTR